MDLVRLMGGRVYLDLNVSVTHLIAGEVGSKKYLVAAGLGKPILLPSWVHACWEKSQDRCDDIFFYMWQVWISLLSTHNDFCELLNPSTVFSGTPTFPLRTICVRCYRVALFLLRAYPAQSGRKCSGCVSSTELTTPASLKWMSAHTSSLVNHQVNYLHCKICHWLRHLHITMQ